MWFIGHVHDLQFFSSAIVQWILDISVAGGFECHMYYRAAGASCWTLGYSSIYVVQEWRCPKYASSPYCLIQDCMYHCMFRRTKIQMTNLWVCVICRYQCGNFVASCNGISISGSNLAATCKDGHGSSHFTELDLNPHLSNVNGILEPGGAYIETCTPQGGRQEGSSFFIFAQCSREDGKVVPTFFDVNNNVANIFGTLEWFDCNQLLAMDEIAAADEDVALSGRKLLNHWSWFNEENNAWCGYACRWSLTCIHSGCVEDRSMYTRREESAKLERSSILVI